MKKLFFVVFALCSLFFVHARANVITGVAKIPENYYDDVDGKKSPDAILQALFEIIDDHTAIDYGALENYYDKTDLYSDTIWDIYSTCKFFIDDANCSQKAVCDCWNKEHSIPQSWFNEGKPMKSDLFHVYPTDARVNNFRSNLPYGEVDGTNGKGFPDNKGGHGLGKKGANTFPGYSGTVFEPADEFKGDLARTYFYMCARDRDKDFTQASEGAVVFTKSPANLTEFARELFLKWHRNDPVSQKEIDRNEAVYGIQKNRNPFIDYPDLVEYIWGTKVNQQVDLASMIPTCEGGTVTPVIIIKHGVEWMVNGEKIQIDSIQENKKVAALPEKPLSCSTESSEFVGWTNTPIVGTSDEVPSVLYTSAKDIAAITQDTAFYAVFAKVTKGEGKSSTVEEIINLTAQGFSDKQVISSPVVGTNVTVTFAQGSASTAPTYYSSGGAVRLYAGGTMTVDASHMTQIDLTFGTDDKSNAISTDVGDFTSPTWTGTADQVIFTIGGANGHRRIASVAVTCSGEGVVYSRYLTNCEDEIPTKAVKPATEEPYATKILINGQLFILLNGKIYTLTGQNVK